MNEVNTSIKKGLQDSYSYEAYLSLIESLLVEGKSTTKAPGKAAESFVQYSSLGLQRMKRWNKKFNLTSNQKKQVQAYDKKRTWIVLTEGWCGDAAHSLPVIHVIAKTAVHIELRIVLREEHPDLMNDFLTNGSKSIPKLIVYDQENKEVEHTWGPRPTGAKEIFEANRGQPSGVSDKKLQLWYNKDKGETTAEEVLKLLS